MLGLLPSPENGWDLAAKALKSTGEMIHLHENVGVQNIDAFIEKKYLSILYGLAS